jgi:tetratricopeptide (TPR) repeat protein
MTVQADQLRGGAGKTGTFHWDISRTTQLPQAMDFFFDIPKGQRKWISAVDGDGYGLVQTSTDVLQGRKLFVWGMGAGGRNWQTFLSQPGSAYIELQAGLARTQLEHLPMKGGAVISWLEAYGPIAAKADIVHGRDWNSSVLAMEKTLEYLCPRALVEQMHEKAKQELDNRKGKIRTVGEGWALVQEKLLKDKFRNGGLHFPGSCIGRREKPWLQLIHEGALPCPGVLEEPSSYQIGTEWEQLLADSIHLGGSRHWYGYYQYGVMLAYAGKLSEAEESFDESIQCETNPWALRCKAILQDIAGNTEEAAKLLVQAVTMLPERNIAKEALQILHKAGKSQEIVHLYDRLPNNIRTLGRIKVLLIEALLNTGDIVRAERMLNSNIVLTDVREGEVKLTDLWFRMMAEKHAQERGIESDDSLLEQIKKACIPPSHLDFRMH